MRVSTGQTREWLVREARGDYGPEGAGEDFQWFMDNWQIVRDLRKCELKLPRFPCQTNCPELFPQWWKVVEDIVPTIKSVAGLDFISLLEEEDEPYVTGEEMRLRAAKLKANFGLADAKWLLGHQEEIPEAIHGKVIVLAGTVLSDSDEALRVASLIWNGGRWILRWLWLGAGFGNLAVLPRSRFK